LPADLVRTDRLAWPPKVAATFENGLLTITLPKTENAQANAKRIAISSEK
jgi:HSP20 family molecular chaperone IbpA